MPHYRERGPYRRAYYPFFYYRPRYYIHDGIRYYNDIPIKRGLRWRPVW